MRYQIMARDINGETIECFVWTRTEESGISRAYYDAPKFGVELQYVWAEPLDDDEEGKSTFKTK